MRTLLVLAALSLAPDVFAQGRGVQVTPDEERNLANLEQGSERWAVTRHPSGTITGNVFKTNGGAPSFLVCSPLEEPERYECVGGDGCAEGARAASKNPFADQLLANKDVGSQRWAITRNEDGTLTGNVFDQDGSPPVFVYCDPNGQPDGFTCFGADRCHEEICVGPWTLIGDIELPAGFLDRPEACLDEYTLVASNIRIPDEIFTPEFCGNGIRDKAEDCDGSDAGLCESGACLADCSCQPIVIDVPCVDISGPWDVHEEVEGVCRAGGQSERFHETGGGSIIIHQDGCNISYTVPGTSLQRNGTVDGNFVSVSGPFALDSGELDLSRNEASASGVVDGDRLPLHGNGIFEGRIQGVTVRCTATSNALLTR